ncbi:hypothetical protein ACE1TF_13920 [Geomicrobium sp. JSM 1781026]|uniref:hypothetical protein n=1 Tax=Geomicrobium sp. JSM 1781026 TaxID=3344580 RepID=UPI0035C11B96
MTNPNGTNVPVVAQDIEAGATEAVFEFETPLSLVHAGTWTVNGVDFTVDFGIASVETLDNQGQVVEVVFNAEVDEIAPNNLVVRNANTRVRQGIQDIEVDGNVATVQFVESEGGAFLAPLTPYEFRLTIPGFAPATYIYERPAFLEEVRVVDSSASNGTLTFNDSDDTTLNAPEGTDFEAVLGTGGTVAYDSNDDIVDFFIDEEEVLYGAVTDVRTSGGTPVEIELNGEWYDLEEGYAMRYQGVVGESLAGDLGDGEPTADYAKFVLNSSGEVAFYDAYDWDLDAPILVEEVEDGIVSGFGQEIDASDYTVIEGGQTINVNDLQRGDNLYYNDEYEYAEVFNNIVVGEVEEVFSNSVIVDGTEYSLEGARYVDENGNVQPLDAPILEGFVDADEPVTLYLNRAGEISFVLGDMDGMLRTGDGVFLSANANSFTQGNRGILELSFTDLSGETASESLHIQGLQQINGFVRGQVSPLANDNRVVQSFTYTDVENSGTGSVTVNFTNEDTLQIIDSLEATFAAASVPELIKNNDGDIVGIRALNVNDDITTNDFPVDVGENFIGNSRTYSGTPVILYNEATNQVDEIYTWGNIEDFDLITGGTVYADNQHAGVADYIVVTREQAGVDQADEGVTSVVDRTWLNAQGTQVTRVRVLENGEYVTYNVEAGALPTNLTQGTVVNLVLNNNDVVVGNAGFADGQLISGATVTATSNTNREFTLDGRTENFQLESGGYVIDNRGDGQPSTTSFSTLVNNLEDGDTVDVLLAQAGTRFVDIVVINGEAVDDGDGDDDEPGETPQFENEAEAITAIRDAFAGNRNAEFTNNLRGLFDLSTTPDNLAMPVFDAYADQYVDRYTGERTLSSLSNFVNQTNRTVSLANVNNATADNIIPALNTLNTIYPEFNAEINETLFAEYANRINELQGPDNTALDLAGIEGAVNDVNDAALPASITISTLGDYDYDLDSVSLDASFTNINVDAESEVEVAIVDGEGESVPSTVAGDLDPESGADFAATITFDPALDEGEYSVVVSVDDQAFSDAVTFTVSNEERTLFELNDADSAADLQALFITDLELGNEAYNALVPERQDVVFADVLANKGDSFGSIEEVQNLFAHAVTFRTVTENVNTLANEYTSSTSISSVDQGLADAVTALESIPNDFLAVAPGDNPATANERTLNVVRDLVAEVNSNSNAIKRSIYNEAFDGETFGSFSQAINALANAAEFEIQ